MVQDPCRNACAERCAEVGDPPCYDVIADQRYEDPTVPEWSPCDDCKRDCGIEVIEQLDRAAAVRPLL